MGCHIKPEQFFNLIFGYYDRYIERKSTTTATAGTNTFSATAVPAGEVWVVTSVRAVNINTNNSEVEFGIYDGTSRKGFYRTLLPGANKDMMWNGHVYLKEADYIQAIFYGCTLNDDIYVDIFGYKMKVA